MTEPRQYYQWTGVWEYQNQAGELYLKAKIGDLVIYLFQNKGIQNPKAPTWLLKFNKPVAEIVTEAYRNEAHAPRTRLGNRTEASPGPAVREPGEETPF